MSGPFYGALAASASVFVAILTALLVNNYVQIKSDRRQVKNELNQIEEDLDGIQDRRDDYQETADDLVEKREADYRLKAEEQVNKFIGRKIPSDISKPIEKLDVDELYQELIDFYDCDDANDLEDSPKNYHHRDVLEENLDEIENKILKDIIPDFSSDYEGDGWEYDFDKDDEDLPDALRVLEEVHEPLELDEFIQEYKNKYDLEDLDDKTNEILESQYNEVVNKNPDPPEEDSSDDTRPLTSTEKAFAQLASAMPKDALEPTQVLPETETRRILGLTSREQQKLEEAQEQLRDAKNQIQVLERRKSRLESQKEGLHPEDLMPTLAANVATIILSVVIPVFAYLLFTTNTAVTVPNWLWLISHTEVNVFLSWLLGLIVVFESIHARMNDREPKAYSLYKQARGRLSRD